MLALQDLYPDLSLIGGILDYESGYFVGETDYSMDGQPISFEAKFQ